MNQGGNRAIIPLAPEENDKDRIHAAQGLIRIGIKQSPAIAFPGQGSCNMVRPIALLLDTECEALEEFKVLMALGNLASQNESMKKRILKDAAGGKIARRHGHGHLGQQLDMQDSL